MKILLGDNDYSFARALQKVLERRGIAVEVALTPALALNRIQLSAADVVLLDLRSMDGVALLQSARGCGARVPVLVLGAEGDARDRVACLNAGADDFLSKPFDLDELEARARALHRRHVAAFGEELRCGPLVFDRLSGTFHVNGGLLDLTPRERAFIEALMPRAGRAVPKDRVFRAVFGAAEAGCGAIDVLASRVRKKLCGTGVSLATLRGVGYVLEHNGSITPAP